MTNQTNNLLQDFDTLEATFYAKLVPELLKELTQQRKLLAKAKQELAKLQQTQEALYKDYQTVLAHGTKETKKVGFWRIATASLVLILISFLILGSM